MGWVADRLGSSIGLKFLMALTGLMLLGFVGAHLLGNLLIYAGPEALNAYARGLKELPYGLLNVARAGLLVTFGVHILVALKLQLQAKAARPVPYAHKSTIQASMASRTMIYSGLLLLAFVLFHLAHFTWGLVQPQPLLESGEVDVYAMVVAGFRVPALSALYVVSMVVLGLHLSHGISSVFQTLGLYHRNYLGGISVLSKGLAWGLALGNISIPVSVFLGFVK